MDKAGQGEMRRGVVVCDVVCHVVCHVVSVCLLAVAPVQPPLALARLALARLALGRGLRLISASRIQA